MKNSNALITIALAAILAVLIVVAYSTILNDQRTATVFDTTFSPYPNVLSASSRSESSEISELQNIMALYESKNYGKLIKGIDSYLKDNPDEYQLKFYRGIAYVELGNPGKAVTDFEDVMLVNADLVDQAEWYLALTYLKLNNKVKASDLFSSVAEKNNSFSEKAKRVIAELNYSADVEQEKYYQVNADGRFEFYYWKEENPVQHLVTERTFYLETLRQGIIPTDISYSQFAKMTADEKRGLIENSQENILTAIQNSKRDLYEEIKNAAALPDASALAQLEQQKLDDQAIEEELPVAETESPEEVMSDVAEIEEEITEDTLMADEGMNEPTPPQPRKIPVDLGLPWIIDAMLRAETGKDLPAEVEFEITKSNEEIPWIVEVLTNPVLEKN